MLRRTSLGASRQLIHRLLCPRLQNNTTVAAFTSTASPNWIRASSKATPQPYAPPPLQPSGKAHKADKESRTGKGSKPRSANTGSIEEKFGRIGLNANVSKQLAATHPFIEKPTLAQNALIPAILSPIDVILRAQTGTGKSFGILLALLSKPRIVFRVRDDEEGTVRGKLDPFSTGIRPNKIQAGIASIVVVPSNELAAQYMRWAQSLFPKQVLPSLDPIVQCLVRGRPEGPDALSHEQEIQRLKDTPPHILIITPGRLSEILSTAAGPTILGVATLRTLVLDEADAILQLPGRFPSAKQRWNHEVHMPPGLEVLNYFMQHRATFSGGEKHMSAGLENRPGKTKDERRPPEHIRRHTYQTAERRSSDNTSLVAPLPRTRGTQPLQLVCTSATANSVLRHFMGARTGWLRPGARETPGSNEPQLARWIDLTGLSGQSMVRQGIVGLLDDRASKRSNTLIEETLEATNNSMPSAIEHTCLVVDEAPLSQHLSRAPLRNFSSSLARLYPRFVEDDVAKEVERKKFEDMLHVVKPDNEPAEHEVDQTLIEALAFSFASEGVERGLALIPARWSLLKTRASLEALGVPVRTGLNPAEATSSAAEPELFLLQTTSARGLDIPSLSHVFLLGIHAVVDTVQYVHSAGRVSRIGRQADQQRAAGKVVVLIRGIPHKTPLPSFPEPDESEYEDGRPPRAKRILSASELKMANLYKRLRITPRKLNLRLLGDSSQYTEASPQEYDEANTVDVDAASEPTSELEEGGSEAATEEIIMDADESETAPATPHANPSTVPNEATGEAEQVELKDSGREAATEEVVMDSEPPAPSNTK